MKPKTLRDKKYLEWVRTLPCIVCQSTPAVPHHEGVRGMGLKASDRDTLPLCHKHHDERHRTGVKTFWGSIDYKDIISRLNAVYDRRSP